MERAIFGQITFSNSWSLGKFPSKKVLILAIFKNCWFKNKANGHPPLCTYDILTYIDPIDAGPSSSSWARWSSGCRGSSTGQTSLLNYTNLSWQIYNICFSQYQESFAVYKATAQHWSHVYAGSEHRVFYWQSEASIWFLQHTFQHPEYEGMLRQLQDMGIDEVVWNVFWSMSTHLKC